MSLNFKNPKAHRLAQATTQDSGARKSKARLAELMAIAKRVSRDMKRPYVEHDRLLYNEHGVPK